MLRNPSEPQCCPVSNSTASPRTTSLHSDYFISSPLSSNTQTFLSDFTENPEAIRKESTYLLLQTTANDQPEPDSAASAFLLLTWITVAAPG